jgi:tetratricopeptide (TPR) repeat protein
MDEVQDLIQKIDVLFDKGEHQKIVDLLTDKLLDKYQNADLYARRSLAYNHLSEVEKSIEYANKALAADPNNSLAYRNLGFAWKAKGDLDKSLVDYNKTIQLDPNDSNAYSNRGLIWHEKGQYDKAIVDYDEALKLDPADTTTCYNRALALYKKGEYDKAYADCEKAIKLNPTYSDAYSLRGIIWYMKGEYDKALADYDKAVEIKPDPISYFNRGLTWSNKGEYDKAISDYNKVIALIPNDADTYYNRGLVWFKKGEYEKAIADYNKVIELTPDDAEKFWEKDLLMAKEKLEERKILETSKASVDDKAEKIKLEKSIDRAINIIRKSAGSKVKTLVHYTKVFVTDIYVKSLGAKMHYSNAIYMNDPMEGKVLFEFLDEPLIQEAYENGEKRTETSVYLGSFLPAEEHDGKTSHEDELVMWRTYGKDETGKEATGCSVVLNSEFFKTESSKELLLTKKAPEEELLNVVYMKIHKNRREIIDDPKEKIKSAIDDLKGQLQELINLRNKYDKKDDFYKDIENTIFKKLSNITYLFKSADYSFEHEVRVITYMPRNSDTIKHSPVSEPNMPCKRFFIESYNDILPYIKKIFLGPKVQNHQYWSLYFDYEIRQRAKELEAMPSRPYSIKPSEIEIMKSVCKFQ